MTGKSQIASQDSLRRKAEDINRKREADNREVPVIVDESSRMVHELRVHQIQLEMQNDELRRIYQAREEEHERYLELYDFAPVGYCSLSKQGCIVEINLTASTMLEVGRIDLIGQYMICLIYDEDRHIFSEKLNQLFATKEAQNCEVRMIKSSGILFWASVEAVTKKSEGIPVCRIVMSDISDRKKTERALIESEVHFRHLANCGQVLIWSSGEDKLCNYFNEPWLAFTGRTIEQEFGNGWVEGVHADDLDRCIDTYVTAFDRHEPFSMEYRLRHASGEYRWVLDQGTPRYDSQGAFLGYIGHCLDITEHKRSEEALHASLAEKEVLLREVHHRVKNNLAAIIGLLELQRRSLNDPTAQTALADLSGRIRSMSLVHEKLYRSESLSEINFQDYIRNLVSHLRTSFGSPLIQCDVHAEGVNMPLDLAVPCGMIINELMTNALKYAFPDGRSASDEGTCSIAVSLTHEQGVYTLTVADNGVGLPQEFDLATVKTLGLVMVRMLGQHQLGGQFEFFKGHGTRVRLVFQPRQRREFHV
jgi:PAS domain S-box-containing protein